MRRYNHLTETFKESKDEGSSFRVHVTYEKDLFILADNKEDLQNKLDNLDYSSFEETLWTEGADSIDSYVKGESTITPQFVLESTDMDTFVLSNIRGY